MAKLHVYKITSNGWAPTYAIGQDEDDALFAARLAGKASIMCPPTVVQLDDASELTMANSSGTERRTCADLADTIGRGVIVGVQS